MKTANLTELHKTLCERLAAFADAADGLFDAADEVAAVAEADPALASYLEALTPLLSVAVPSAPPLPNA